VKFPALPNLNAVAPKTGLPEPPYNRCIKINMGHCPLWETRRASDEMKR
jgi:hypothetical protein